MLIKNSLFMKHTPIRRSICSLKGQFKIVIKRSIKVREREISTPNRVVFNGIPSINAYCYFLWFPRLMPLWRMATYREKSLANWQHVEISEETGRKQEKGGKKIERIYLLDQIHRQTLIPITGVGVHESSISIGLIQNNLISKINCLNVISDFFHPIFHRSSSPPWSLTSKKINFPYCCIELISFFLRTMLIIK